MAVVLYMTVSQDGFIATPEDETPWDDASWESFRQFVSSCDVVLLGRRTFEIMRDQNEFVSGPRYIVVTENEDLNVGDYTARAIRTGQDIPHADRVGIIGGGELNGRLARLGLLDEMILDIESITLHEGIRLFGKYDVPLKLKLLGSRQLSEATVQRHYQIIKPGSPDDAVLLSS